MASERLHSAQDLLDLTFQSLAMQHMDLKQVELDTAVAKVDELSRQLESLWTDGPGPPKETYSPSRTRSPLGRRSLAPENLEMSGDTLGRPGSPRTLHYLPGEDRAPSPRPKVLAVPYEGLALPSPGGRAPSPRPHRSYEFLGLGGSPRPGEGPVFFPERAPSPRPPAPPPYEVHGLYPSVSSPAITFRAQGTSEGQPGLRPSLGLSLAPWRESSLDGAGGQSKDGAYGGHSATLPRNYKVSPLAGERRAEGPFRRSGPGTLPRSWHFSQQPVSRIPVPPQGGRPPRHKPLPLSMIFKLQNAFWEQGVGGPRGLPLVPPAGPRAPQKQPQLPVLPQAPPAVTPGWEVMVLTPAPALTGSGRPVPPETVLPEGEPELERLLQGGEAEGLERPLSPTRLQPLLPPEAQRVPEFEEVARVLAEMPRPLKRRGSMEQSPGPALPPSRTRQYQQLITRLLHRPPRRDEPLAPGDTGASSDLPPPAPAAPEARPPRHSPPPQSPSSPAPALELRSALRDPSSPRRRPGARVRLNPLVLLLDAALTGELDVVQQAVAELNDPSQPNDEGITALHNAICGANYSIVDFLIASGANVNSPDSHGWTPLHCAASCNDTGVCVALVRHGAAIFATTTSDGSLAVEKCDPYREGYADCYNYLTEVEQSMGVLNSGVVYALWDYSAEFGDELSFREGEPITVLRRQPQEELDWWWGSLYGHEGYVPRNYFGLFPRVRPQRKKV
ncbi:PREDICTED: relA-associated inhibitor [Haliaeetus leucocephalus]|uniref:relA-associated inhibitor n=1 Tax=Haliaeetus leucocephalus TaxID=52644 RepID=UPI00053CCE47|nr:PREDICTED: relA-associated inhibitor [Haliaeetus leucocephalus]